MNRKQKGFPRVLIAILSFIVGAAVMLGVFALGGGSAFEDILGVSLGSSRRPGSAGADANAEDLLRQAYAALAYMEDGDYGGLSRMAHPDKGILFSPYATISLPANRQFTQAQLAALGGDGSVYVWGLYDGSGEPIELTPAEYFARFVLDRDYSEAPAVGIDYVVRSGNALENIREIMPGARFVDFHIPASEEGGMDWSSLRLGFEEYHGILRLTFIGHSEWTV